MKNQRITLTEGLIGAVTCPRDRNWKPLWDARQPGLLVRVYPTGTKTYYFSYRVVGGGRKSPQKWLRLGSVDALSLKDARDAARIKAGEVAKGRDPAVERRQERRRSRARLEPALERYEESLRERGVVKRREVLSLLRRELLAPFGNVDIAELDRASLVDRIDAVRRGGRPGTARELRTRTGVSRAAEKRRC